MASTFRSKRYRKKRVNNLLRAAICVTALAILVLVIQIFTGFLGRLLPASSKKGDPDAAPGKPGILASGTFDIPDFRLSLLASLGSEAGAGTGTPSGDAGLAGSENGITSGRPAGSENGQAGTGGGADGGGNGQANSTSHTMNNEQIDISGLDTTSMGWGPGTNCDEQNRPNSALSYQEAYGKYNANFIVPDSNKIFLTFDEGYENGRTSDLLDVLKAKNLKTVFFVTLPYVKQNPDLVRRMIDEGHTVGAHSVTHPADGLPSLSVEQQQNEITELHNYVKDNFNYEMHLFRFPAGIFSEQSLAIVNNCNYKSVFWSFAYLDYDTENQPDPAQALEKLKTRMHPGAIYLLHAVSSTNVQILGDFIDYIQSQGYEIGVFD